MDVCYGTLMLRSRKAVLTEDSELCRERCGLRDDGVSGHFAGHRSRQTETETFEHHLGRVGQPNLKQTHIQQTRQYVS